MGFYYYAFTAHPVGHSGMFWGCPFVCAYMHIRVAAFFDQLAINF